MKRKIGAVAFTILAVSLIVAGLSFTGLATVFNTWNEIDACHSDFSPPRHQCAPAFRTCMSNATTPAEEQQCHNAYWTCANNLYNNYENCLRGIQYDPAEIDACRLARYERDLCSNDYNLCVANGEDPMECWTIMDECMYASNIWQCE